MTKIFIAEDDPLMADLYEQIFRTNGFTIELAYDGQETLDKLRTATVKPDIIMLDILMPKMSGFEVLTQIKKLDSLKEVPVLVLSNLSGVEHVETALSKGAEEYLVKSDYDPQQIVRKVKEVIARNSRAPRPSP